MDGNNGTGMRSQNLVKLPPVHHVGYWIDIDKDGRGSHDIYGFDGGDKCVGDGNDFVARPNLTGPQGEDKRVSSRCKTYPITAVAVVSKFLFKSLCLRAKKKLHVRQNLLNCGH